MDWQYLKEAIEASTGLERDALHIYAAIGVHLVAAVVTRRPLSHFLPWTCVLAVELGNEAADLLKDGIVEEWEVRGSLHDLWNTMLPPSVLLLVTRFAPSLAVGKDRLLRLASDREANSEDELFAPDC